MKTVVGILLSHCSYYLFCNMSANALQNVKCLDIACTPFYRNFCLVDNWKVSPVGNVVAMVLDSTKCHHLAMWWPWY